MAPRICLKTLYYRVGVNRWACSKVPQNMHALVSTLCSTTRAKNEGRRACDSKTWRQMAQKRR